MLTHARRETYRLVVEKHARLLRLRVLRMLIGGIEEVPRYMGKVDTFRIHGKKVFLKPSSMQGGTTPFALKLLTVSEPLHLR